MKIIFSQSEGTKQIYSLRKGTNSFKSKRKCSLNFKKTRNFQNSTTCSDNLINTSKLCKNHELKKFARSKSKNQPGQSMKGGKISHKREEIDLCNPYNSLFFSLLFFCFQH